MKPDYEHTETMREAREALIKSRKRVRHLHWISGGKGYNNMGKRELEIARTKLDEAEHWLSAASGSLNAGAKRAIAEGYRL